MAHIAYRFRTDIGTFVIRAERHDPRRAELWVNGECCGSYVNARKAASSVRSHATGFERWDAAPHLQPPAKLKEWQQVLDF